MTHPGEKEEAVYIRQVRRYRRRFRYTMVHDRRDRRAEAPSQADLRPSKPENMPSPAPLPAR